jgi:hypothetical protein
VKHAGVPLAAAKAEAEGRAVEGKVAPWRRVGIFAGASGKVRFSILEPADEAQEIHFGSLFVRGRFQVVEKINNAKRAREAWESFEPA